MKRYTLSSFLLSLKLAFSSLFLLSFSHPSFLTLSLVSSACSQGIIITLLNSLYDPRCHRSLLFPSLLSSPPSLSLLNSSTTLLSSLLIFSILILSPLFSLPHSSPPFPFPLFSFRSLPFPFLSYLLHFYITLLYCPV
jgi:hypothetical protein